MKTTVTVGEKEVVVNDGDNEVASFKIDSDGDIDEIRLFDNHNDTIIDGFSYLKQEVHEWIDDLVKRVIRLQTEIRAHVPKPVKKKPVKKTKKK